MHFLILSLLCCTVGALSQAVHGSDEDKKTGTRNDGDGNPSITKFGCDHEVRHNSAEDPAEDLVTESPTQTSGEHMSTREAETILSGQRSPKSRLSGVTTLQVDNRGPDGHFHQIPLPGNSG